MPSSSRPHTTVVLAMSADGKIADQERSPARFGSAADKAHLEAQIAQADGVLFGAGTLRAYGTTLSVRDPGWLEWRSHQQKPTQPVQIVVSRTAQIDPQIRFFRQPVPRWLVTNVAGKKLWQNSTAFEQILSLPETAEGLDWQEGLSQLWRLGLEKIVVTGGGELVASLLAIAAIDKLWLTICPLLIGGKTAPTSVEGHGFSLSSTHSTTPQLELLETKIVDQEVFLYYRVR